MSRRRASPPQATKLRRERRADIKQQICAQQQPHPDHLCWGWRGGLAEMTRGPNRFNLTLDECIHAYTDTDAAQSAVEHRTTFAVSIKYAENFTVTRNHAVKRIHCEARITNAANNMQGTSIFVKSISIFQDECLLRCLCRSIQGRSQQINSLPRKYSLLQHDVN